MTKYCCDLPPLNTPQWLDIFANSWKDSVDDKENLDALKQMFDAKKLKVATMSFYFSALKNLLILKNKITNQDFSTRIAELESNFDDQSDKLEARAIIAMFEVMPTSYSQYKYYLQIVKKPITKVKLFIKEKIPFFRPPWDKCHLSLNLLYPNSINEIKEKSDEVLKNTVPVLIEKPSEFIDTILSGLYSCNKRLLFPAILLACGRRYMGIILYSDDYKESSKGPEAYECKYTERLKRGLKQTSDEIIETTIPLLCPFQLFRTALDRAMKTVECKMDKKSIHRYISRNLSRWVQNRTNMKMKPHMLRSIYACCLAEQNKMAFVPGAVSQSLQHENIYNALHYMKVRFGDEGKSLQPWKPPCSSCEPDLNFVRTDYRQTYQAIPIKKRSMKKRKAQQEVEVPTATL